MTVLTPTPHRDYPKPGHGHVQSWPPECECGVVDGTVDPVAIAGHTYSDARRHWLCEACRSLVMQGLAWRSPCAESFSQQGELVQKRGAI